MEEKDHNGAGCREGTESYRFDTVRGLLSDSHAGTSAVWTEMCFVHTHIPGAQQSWYTEM